MFDILIAAGATTSTASEALRVKLLLQRDEDLFNAASNGELHLPNGIVAHKGGGLGKLKELIAAGADPNGYTDEVRVIADAGRALCATAEAPRVGRLGVGSRRSSSRPRASSGSALRRVVAVRIGRRRRRRLNRQSLRPVILDPRSSEVL